MLKTLLKKIADKCGYVILRNSENISIENVNQEQKYTKELSFWKRRHREESNSFKNDHFKKIMLGMANEQNDDFLQNKTVIDFGCGPRGSLVWTDAPSLKIGADILTDLYIDNFPEDIKKHDYIYIKTTENHIPLPNEYADVLFTMNALDHVMNLEQICNELLRVLKKGGDFIASLNMNEAATYTEPQTLTYEIVNRLLLNNLQISFSRKALPADFQEQINGSNYNNFFNTDAILPNDEEEHYLWIRGKKK